MVRGVIAAVRDICDVWRVSKMPHPWDFPAPSRVAGRCFSSMRCVLAGIASLGAAAAVAAADDVTGAADWRAGEYLPLIAMALLGCFVLIKLMRVSRHASGPRRGAGAVASNPTATVRQLGAVLDMVSDAAAVVDARGRIVWANAAMARRLELPPAGLVGTDLTRLLHEGATIRDLGGLGAGCDGLRAVVFTRPMMRLVG